MFSGKRPRGSSRAPVNGKTGIVSGSSSIRKRRPACAVMIVPPRRRSGKHQRRQPAAPRDGERACRAQRFEELDQLPARTLFVPFAVALVEVEQLLDRGVLLAGREER